MSDRARYVLPVQDLIDVVELIDAATDGIHESMASKNPISGPSVIAKLRDIRRCLTGEFNRE